MRSAREATTRRRRMNRRSEWRKILDAEVERWSKMSCEQLLSELEDIKAYTVDDDSKTYQVEVQLLENTDSYLHVMVAVDDGHLPASFRPATDTFIRQKEPPAD